MDFENSHPSSSSDNSSSSCGVKQPRKRNQSLGRHCAAATCTSRQYTIVNDERIPTAISFFKFPTEKSTITHWCTLIRRRNNCDGFVVSNATRLCEKHFVKNTIYRPPGGTRLRLIGDGKPILHSWNNFTVEEKKRKSPAARVSPSTSSRRKLLFEPDDNQEQVVTAADATDFVIANVDSDDVVIIEETESSSTSTIDQSADRVKFLESKIAELEKSLQESQGREKDVLIKINSAELPIVGQVLSSDDMCNHYTGFPSISRLKSVFEFLDTGDNGENVILYQNQGNKETGVGRPRSLSPFNCFILTLLRLRRNFDVVHLSFLFNINHTTVSNTIITWINYMYIKLGSIPIWPTMQHVAKCMPKSMKSKFPYVKIIIDCVEFRVETASSLVLHKLFYSDYKSHTTVKCLVGICPGGGFSFISPVFPGSISDKEITVRSGLLKPALWNPGEGLMADRGFTIKDYTDNLNIKLVIPAFLKGRDQLSEAEVIQSQQIASERIHVERMIQRLKTYHIFDRVIPMSMMGSLNQIITVCALLSNFQDPIIAPQHPQK